jgi:hypothetical protein
VPHCDCDQPPAVLPLLVREVRECVLDRLQVPNPLPDFGLKPTSIPNVGGLLRTALQLAQLLLMFGEILDDPVGIPEHQLN